MDLLNLYVMCMIMKFWEKKLLTLNRMILFSKDIYLYVEFAK